MKFDVNSIEQTKNLAEGLAGLLCLGDVVALKGDLGIGKTAFARFLIQALCGKNCEVLSPTFNLVYPYEAKEFSIWHFDLYRIEDVSEVEAIGIYEAFDEGVSVIEWPEIIHSILPTTRLLVEMCYENNIRRLRFEGFGGWKERMIDLERLYGTT